MMKNMLFHGVCHLILADQSEGLIINDVAIAGTKNGRGNIRIQDMAESAAQALGVGLRRFFLPLPHPGQWTWADMPQMLQQHAETVMARRELTVICAELNSGRALHFCDHPVLSCVNHDVWFPIGQTENLFQAIERVMVTNHQAVNVTRTEVLSRTERSEDHRVTFNVPVTGLKI